MGRTLYTLQGLTKLAEIVKVARNGMSYRNFEQATGVSHATLRRIEIQEVKEPEISTLRQIQPFTPYTLAELIAVCQSSPQVDKVREYRTAEDVLPFIRQLPDIEAAQVAQEIIARLAKPEVKSGDNGEGVTFQIQLMSQRQLANLLRAIASRLDG